MKPDKQKGYDFTAGCVSYLGLMWIIGVIAFAAFDYVRDTGNWGLDSTDRDGRHRSGLTLHVDYKTGVEYLSDGKGGLIRRETK